MFLLLVLLPACGGHRGGGSTTDFLSYLREARGTIIALSPTNHDPRLDDNRKVPSPESLRLDLAALRPGFDGFVLYGYESEVTPVLLAEAVRQDFHAALLGVWDPTSETELTGVAELVNQYHGSLALAVCIGNEGIHFGRYSLEQLHNGMARLEALFEADVSVPLCTSEPTVEYRKEEVRELGDFLAMNVHPVWDRPDLGPSDAVSWTRERARETAALAGKPALVKETGFAHGARPELTPDSQAEFWRHYTSRPRVEVLSGTWVSYCAAFEAFELPWKAEQSGLGIEEFWGLLSPSRTPFPAFSVWEMAASRPGVVAELKSAASD